MIIKMKKKGEIKFLNLAWPTIFLGYSIYRLCDGISFGWLAIGVIAFYSLIDNIFYIINNKKVRNSKKSKK